MKSFDARISGKISGWVFAKIIYGAGGSQTTTFAELDTFCNWVYMHRSGRDDDEIFVALVDTDQHAAYTRLKNKYNTHPTLLIVNHLEFQKWLSAVGTDVNGCSSVVEDVAAGTAVADVVAGTDVADVVAAGTDVSNPALILQEESPESPYCAEVDQKPLQK